jgi:hypothetical protein
MFILCAPGPADWLTNPSGYSLNLRDRGEKGTLEEDINDRKT